MIKYKTNMFTEKNKLEAIKDLSASRILLHHRVFSFYISFSILPTSSHPPFFFFLVMPCGLQDLSSPTRNQIPAPCNGSTVLTTEPPEKFLFTYILPSILLLGQRKQLSVRRKFVSSSSILSPKERQKKMRKKMQNLSYAPGVWSLSLRSRSAMHQLEDLEILLHLSEPQVTHPAEEVKNAYWQGFCRGKKWNTYKSTWSSWMLPDTDNILFMWKSFVISKPLYSF